MNNFQVRTITGALFVIVVVGSLIWNLLAFACVAGIFLIVGIWEFYQLIFKIGHKPYQYTGIIAAMAIYIFISLKVLRYREWESSLIYLLILCSLPCLQFFYEVFSRKEKPFINFAFTYLGVGYTAVPFSLLLVLSNFAKVQTGIWTFVILYFFILWTYDTFAYLTGRSFGKHKLMESVSPKKTWEGAFGGLFFSLTLGFILSRYFFFLSTVEWLGLAIIIVVLGTIGDLLESFIKRKAGCKDSGKFFPGHGGILDRFDSVIISAPFVFLYLKILAQI